MIFPELIKLFTFQKFKVRICFISSLEWRTSCVHDEKNDSSSKNICLLSFIVFSVNLWGHISFSSKFSMENACIILSFTYTSKSKICNFQFKILCKQQILWFNVSMCKSFFMNKVKSRHQLMKIRPGDFLTKLSRVTNKVK